MSEQLAFSFDAKRCTGCMACVVACQDQNDIKSGDTSLRRVFSFEEGPYPATLGCLSIACMHCGDAPCVMACPTGAVFKHAESGVVEIRRDLCIGCRSCALACPFGAPKIAVDGRMAKCDMCYVRVAYGLRPACVHTCTTGALNFGKIDEQTNVKGEHAAKKIIKSSGVLVK